jgi:hypothetical protein
LVPEQQSRRDEQLERILDEALDEPAVQATDAVWAGVRRRLDEKHPRMATE